MAGDDDDDARDRRVVDSDGFGQSMTRKMPDGVASQHRPGDLHRQHCGELVGALASGNLVPVGSEYRSNVDESGQPARWGHRHEEVNDQCDRSAGDNRISHDRKDRRPASTKRNRQDGQSGGKVQKVRGVDHHKCVRPGDGGLESSLDIDPDRGLDVEQTSSGMFVIESVNRCRAARRLGWIDGELHGGNLLLETDRFTLNDPVGGSSVRGVNVGARHHVG
jgi:hypothetical protein